MLQRKAVEPKTLELLKSLMALGSLKAYNLAGGTALALQYGHRVSIDLDFFGSEEIDQEDVLHECRKLGELEIIKKQKRTILLKISGIKVDILDYNYKLLKPVIDVEGIRLLSPEDIAAMKLSAISSRGSKKDFYDLYFLLEKFPLWEILNFCESKFPEMDQFHMIKSLNYFEDADLEPEPQLIKPAAWSEVKKKLVLETKKIRI